MSEMAEHSWKFAGNCWKMLEMAGMAENGCERLKMVCMAEIGLKWLQIAENGWKWLERLEMTGNVRKFL